MLHFHERHPPMGSEKDMDNQASTNISGKKQYRASSCSSSSEELDELSLRVRALLAESDEEILDFTSHQESQVSSQSSEIGFDSQAVYGPANLESQELIDKVILSENRKEQDTGNCATVKDSASNIGLHGVHETMTYSCGSEMFEQKKVSFEDKTERYTSEDFFSGSDVTIIEDLKPDMFLYSVPSVKSHEEHEISKDSTSYYSLNDDLEEQTIDYHLKERCCIANLPVLDASFSHTSQYLYYAPQQKEVNLSTDKTSDYSSYSTIGFFSDHAHDKEQDSPSWLRHNDRDTSSLSASSIASSKRLEWDNAADIGYVADNVDESKSRKKSRKEPEGFSSHKFSYGTSSKYSKIANKQFLNANDTGIAFEKEDTITEIPRALESQDQSHVADNKISNLNRDFSKKDKFINEESLQFTTTQSSIVSESICSLKETFQIHPDLSVRPKDKIYVKKDKHCKSKSITPKDQPFVLEKDTIYLENKELKISESDINISKACEMSNNKRLSPILGKDFDSDMNIVGIIKPERDEKSSVRDFEPYPCHALSSLPEEYQKHILSGSIFIDSGMVVGGDFYSKPAVDNTISSSEVLPHIRWYPIPSYKSSQDIRNVSTQTSVCQSNESATQFQLCDELRKNLIESSDTAEHMHTHREKSVDRNLVNTNPPPSEWQSDKDVNLTSEFISECIDQSNMKFSSIISSKKDTFEEPMTSPRLYDDLRQSLVECSDLKHLHLKQNIDRSPVYSCPLPTECLSSKGVNVISEYVDLSNLKFHPSVLDQAEKLNESTISTQTHNELEQSLLDSSDVISHLHTKGIIDRNPVISFCMPADEVNYKLTKENFKNIITNVQNKIDDINEKVATSVLKNCSDDNQGNSPSDIIVESFKEVGKYSHAFKYVPTVAKSEHVSSVAQTQNVHTVAKNQDVHNVAKRKDVSIQVDTCDCLNKFKDILKEALDKISEEKLYPIKLSEKKEKSRSPSHCVKYDVLFLDDDTLKIIDTDASPLIFRNMLLKPLRHGASEKKPVKKFHHYPKLKRSQQRFELRKKLLRITFRERAKRFSRQLVKAAIKGKVDHDFDEHIL